MVIKDWFAMVYETTTAECQKSRNLYQPLLAATQARALFSMSSPESPDSASTPTIARLPLFFGIVNRFGFSARGGAQSIATVYLDASAVR